MPFCLIEGSFPLYSPLSSVKRRRKSVKIQDRSVCASCKSSSDEEDGSSRRGGDGLAKLALVAMAAGILTMGSADPAAAAKSGGRVGGQAFRSTAPPPRSSGPRSNSSRSNVYVNPQVAPPLLGGYGFGSPFYGGWGWSPFSFYAPGPSVAVGIGGGLDLFVLFIVISLVSTALRRFFQSREDDDDQY